MTDLVTSAALAERFEISEKKLHELRRAKNWPCVRLGRFDIRFTEQQVEQIIAIQSETVRRGSGGNLTGQTKQSRRRSA
jgi:lipoate-protein ligase A